jgi:hypothetical protein
LGLATDRYSIEQAAGIIARHIVPLKKTKKQTEQKKRLTRRSASF